MGAKMKRITENALADVSDVFSGEMSSLYPHVLEKDVLTTETVGLISSLNNDTRTFIFCGGTCLVKGHKVIQRMSEDADFKIMVTPGYSKSKLRKYLGDLKDELLDLFVDAGYEINKSDIVGKDENKFIRFSLPFESVAYESPKK
jgi:hypothetical protein